MTMEEERTDRSPNTTDVRVRVPRRAAAWGAKTCWARHAIQAVVIAVVGWQAVGHVTSGGESAEAWCPLGGIEGAWTVWTTGRTVAHVHISSIMLAGTVLVLALVGRGFFCGWLCPLGTLQELSLIHISEPTRLGMISYAVFCLKKKKTRKRKQQTRKK